MNKLIRNIKLISVLCQLQWVKEKLSSRKDKFRPFFFDVQSDKNPFFEVFKVPKTKGIALDKFDEIIGGFQFGVRVEQLKGVDNLLFVLQKGFKNHISSFEFCNQGKMEHRSPVQR